MNSFTIGIIEMPVPIVMRGMDVETSFSTHPYLGIPPCEVYVNSSPGTDLVENKHSNNYRSIDIGAIRRDILNVGKKILEPLGVNILSGLTDFSDILNISIEEGVNRILIEAFLSKDFPEYLFTRVEN